MADGNVDAWARLTDRYRSGTTDSGKGRLAEHYGRESQKKTQQGKNVNEFMA